MLAVIEVLEAIRSRLKDDDYTNLRFSDTELLDTLNSALKALIVEFKLNKRQSTLEFKNDESIQIENLLSILEAYYNNQIIECTQIPSNTLSLVVNQNTLSIAPFTSGNLRITYCAHEELTNIEDFIKVPALAKDALVYGTLSKLLEIPTNENNPNTIAIYKQLLKEAKNTLALYINNIYGRNNHFSKVVRV
ncbi:hypothetical protein [Helicobacter suis]|uniref:hypothetical protein n=1 Tax=Helicobacter suis TaxID=104628 RepID=UPI00249156B0|nr:hypothetical protein [Helicobacter suis]